MALPAWPPPQTRYILNPVRGESIPTATCYAHFNTPCAIEKVHQVVYELAAAFEAASGNAGAFSALVHAVNSQAWNQPVLFWPTVLNASGHILATGASASDTYSGPAYVGGWYQDVLESEGRHGTGTNGKLGGVLQQSMWSRIQTAADDHGYFVSHGRDGFHGSAAEGPSVVTRTVDRVNFVMRVSTAVAGDVYVLCAYSAMPWVDQHSNSNCSAAHDALCSITSVRTLL